MPNPTNQLSCCWDTIPDTQNLKEETLHLVHAFRGFSQCWAGCRQEYQGGSACENNNAQFMVARKKSSGKVQERKGEWSEYRPKGYSFVAYWDAPRQAPSILEDPKAIVLQPILTDMHTNLLPYSSLVTCNVWVFSLVGKHVINNLLPRSIIPWQQSTAQRLPRKKKRIKFEVWFLLSLHCFVKLKKN